MVVAGGIFAWWLRNSTYFSGSTSDDGALIKTRPCFLVRSDPPGFIAKRA